MALRKYGLIGFLGLGLALASLPAEAAFLPDYTGNTVFGTPIATADGTVSFAVYATEDGNWTDDWSALGVPSTAVSSISGGVDEAASYVYFFQFVNDNPAGGPNDPLDNLDLPVPSGSLVTSMGFLSGHVFYENGVAMAVTDQNVGLGTDTGVPDYYNDSLPSISGFDLNYGNTAPFVADGMAADPIKTEAFSWFVDMKWANVPAGGYSSVVFYTADQAPADYMAGILGTGGVTLGDVPAVPEPASMILFLTGVLFVFAARRRWAARF